MTESSITYSAVSLALDRDKRDRRAHGARARPARSRRRRGDRRGRRSVLAAARVSRARRRAAAAARQRAGDRHDRRCGPKAIARRCWRWTRRWSKHQSHWLVREIMHVHEAHAEAARPHLALLLRAHRAGLGVRRIAVRAGARRRSFVHVPRCRRGEHDRAVADERRAAADEQRSDAPADALPRRPEARRASCWRTTGRSTPAAPRRRGSSRSRRTKSTGTTKCGWRWKRARRSRRTR